MSPTPVGFQEVLDSRRSIRRFTPDPVDEHALMRILAAGSRAPSAHNRQPWRWVVVKPGEARLRLAEAMESRFRDDLRADGLPADQIEGIVGRGRERLLGSPLAIILCMTLEDMDQYPDDRRQSAERTMAIQSVALAGGHMLLAAHAEGLGACWICSPLFVPDIVRNLLNLPASWEAQGMIILGHPAESGRDRPRRPLEETIQWR